MARRKRTEANSRDEFEELRSRLLIDKHNLDDELVEHPELLFEASKGMMLAISDRDTQKDYLKQIEGRITSRVAEQDPKAAQWKQDRWKEADEEWVDERKKYNRLSKKVNQWQALDEAFKQRGYMLNNLARVFAARMQAEGGKYEYDKDGR